MSSAALAGNISGAPTKDGNISGKGGNISGAPGNISGTPGNISGAPGNISGTPGNISGFTEEAYLALLSLLGAIA
jgi:hypothetical protein